jgi:cofilin
MEDLLNEFIQDLPKNEPRYGVINFVYKKSDGSEKEKIIFISWAPDEAPVKLKMIYASSKDLLKNKLFGRSFEIQANDPEDLNFGNVLALFINFVS